MIFASRSEAGVGLSNKLIRRNLTSKDSIVMAIPRGGVVVAAEIAKKLKLPLGVIVVKKLGAPLNPELAIGATASFGKPVLDRWLIKDLGVSQDFLKKEIATKKKETKSREKFLNITISPKKFFNKTAIVVDDGLATGMTCKMAAKVLRQFEVRKLILAVPCAAPQAIELVKNDYDEVVCLEVNANLMAVGQFYRDFRPVEDNEVKEILDQNAKIKNQN